MNLLKVVTVLFATIPNLSAIHSQKLVLLSKFTTDIIENERVASVLYAKTCWSKADDIAFVKNISIPIQIVTSIEPINLPNDENVNNQWFLIDMNCKQYAKFLSSVDEKYFAHPYRWIFVDAANDSIQHLNFLPGSNIILANHGPNSEQFTLKQGD